MSGPVVSIVMAVYNAEKYLKQAIDSILSQSYTNLDIVIVNDGSTDGSKEIILGYTDPRIRFFENPKNWGIVKTRNRTLDEAVGEYIAVFDSDDIMLPNKIQLQVEFLEKNIDYGMCGTYFETIDGNDKKIKQVVFPSNDKDVKTYLIAHNCFCHSTVMMRSKMAKELMYNQGYDIAEDYELWYRISRLSKITILPVFTTYYRIHGNNISTTKKNQMFAVVNKINKRILTDLPINHTTEELEIHSNALQYNTDYFKSTEKINALEKWIHKLYTQVNNNESYTGIVLYKILAEKWIVTCSKTKQYRKAFFNKLLFIHPSIYFGLFYKKIKKNI